MSNITRVGVDLAKNVFQVHAVDASGNVVTNRMLKRDRFLAWCCDLPPGCLVAMEACSGAHHWCRQLRDRGLDARMIAAQFVAPYRIQGKSGKNDANDAAAICEAASRPHMNFVPPKTLAQQGMLCVHRLREGLKQERTACINRIRGLLAEFGIVLPQSPQVLRQHLSDLIEDAGNDIAGMARLVLQRAQEHWREIEEHVQWCDQRIAAHQKDDEQVQRAAELKGIGPVTASAVVATVGDFKQFKNAAQFGAWLGLTPKQNSSGGKSSLSSITKRGSNYLRGLLIQGAKSVVLVGKHNDDPISQWAQRLRERCGWQKAVVALANKNARILWAVMTKEKRYDAFHVSIPPSAIAATA
ncbi:IS110 family RNA-guided transposase [Polaromonas naphthalenivorans]|uniref:Transposase IS116/IS110/IS902 family protein n=1 Tax=Polaromonas naphthalenivorans (strain CJ2) TaxID=365044 RepID=A1VJC0_POLNA|nr:IS110 family transposase [Polaromonas naphthalenivorans]ABM35748.1 transposase IS116/IS110/IS902 family protein [Polaromonas naphthalenivorans CJ2]ABM36709.1 transposase IS116/IS110/IS902 family protein [Polaromonas naphthalenivorans CJ2]ABM37058.1 transposase IS116/IS110/IS902 family protein [Polaromonas naphthalenivorans CJ2]